MASDLMRQREDRGRARTLGEVRGATWQEDDRRHRAVARPFAMDDVVIDATKPWEWKDRFPIAIRPNTETKGGTRKKCGWTLERPAADAVSEEIVAPAE